MVDPHDGRVDMAGRSRSRGVAGVVAYAIRWNADAVGDRQGPRGGGLESFPHVHVDGHEIGHELCLTHAFVAARRAR